MPDVADLVWLGQLFVGTVFAVSGLAKLVAWRQFRDTLAAMEILPPGATNGVAALLPPAEAILGIAVIGGWWPAVTVPALLALLGAFLGALGLYRWRGGKDLVCGCFADFAKRSSTVGLMFRNLVLLALGLPAAVSSWPAPPGARGWQEWLQGATVALGGFLLWLLAGRLAETVGLLRLGIDPEES